MSLNLSDDTSLVQAVVWFHQAASHIIWTNVDPDLCCHMVSSGHNELMHLTLNTTNITWMEWIKHGIYHTEKKFTTWTDYIQGQKKTTLYKNNAQMDHHSSPSRHHLELAQKWYSTFGHMQFKVWLRLSDLDMLELANHDSEGKTWGIQHRHWIYHTSLPSFKLEKFMQLFQYRDALFVGTIRM